MGFLLRWLAAFVLLALTYNPPPVSYLGWAERDFSDNMPLVVLAGLLLFVGYVIYLRATLRSIGAFVMLLVLAVFGALVTIAIDAARRA